MAEFDYDLAIIGAGPGGYVSAIRASQLGLKTVVIEKDKPGGVCGNWGCIPSKSLLSMAETFHSIKSLEAMGVKVDKTSFDYQKVHARSRAASDRSGKGVAGLLKRNKIELLSATATLTSPHELQLTTAEGKRTVTSKNILIASGSSPRVIPGFEFDEQQVLSSTGILAMDKLPESLVILGAGAIGMELAYIMNAFGVKVSVVEMLDRVLPLEDADISKVVESELKKQGITFLTSTKASDLKKSKAGISLQIETKSGQKSKLEAEKILVAVGRSPNSANLGLEKLGIAIEKGFVVTGDYYQTSVKSVFAIGDLIASPLLAHVASKEGEIAVEYIAGHGHEKRLDPSLIPGAVYTEPGVGSFGLTEAKALEQKLDISVYSFPYQGIGKANAIEKAVGLVKIVCDKKTHEILGGHVVGYSATEMIHEILLARKAELLPEDIASMVHAHPTISEGIMEAMRGIEGWAIHV